MSKSLRISVSVGYDRLQDGNYTYQKCMKRADQKLYLDKEQRKPQSGIPISE